MNITFINANSLRMFSGPEHWLMEVSLRLTKMGHNVCILAPELSHHDRARISFEMVTRLFPDIQYYELKSFHIGLLSESSIPMQIPPEIHPDVIYQFNGYAFQELYGLFISKTKNIPIVYGIHAPLFTNYFLHNMYVRTFFRTLINQVDAVHCVNRGTKHLIRKWGLKNVKFIPNGVDVRKFKPSNKIHKEDIFKILFVGRLAFEKGCDILCSAIDIANRDKHFRSHAKFTIVGKGPLTSKVIKCMSRNPNVSYIEYVKEEEMPLLYQQHDLFVLPARYETFPLPPIEAQASGLVALVSDIDGLREVILPNKSGVLVPRDSPIQLASALLRLEKIYREDYEYFRSMQKAARQNAIIRFDIEKTVKNLEDLFKEVYASHAKKCILKT